MSIVPITFNDKNVASAVDGGLYHAHSGDGILYGCGMYITTTELTINSGLIIACGRVVHIDGSTTLDLSEVMPSSGYLQVVLNVSPLADPLVYLSYNTSGSAVFGDLTQDDINANPSGLYQIELVVLEVGGAGLTGIYSSVGYSGLISASDIIIDNGNVVIKRSGEIVGRLTSNNSGNLFSLAKVESGAVKVGLYGDTNNALIVYGSSGAYIRPKGLNDPTGQMSIGTDGSISAGGQITGGHPNTPRTPSGGATLTASMSQITSISAGIEPSGVYLVTAECDYTPATAVAHYPQLEIQNSIKNTFYTATAGGRHFLISGIVTGVSSIVFRGTTGTGSTNATVNNIVMNIVRLS
ncbi:MAG: hypothetical protein IJH92_03030 [Mogibacterium sp.]|nr:hypothetical protein [Clostridia bacterium]MBR0307845.1 hypothetical protein [Mogibacterium sp.]